MRSNTDFFFPTDIRYCPTPNLLTPISTNTDTCGRHMMAYLYCDVLLDVTHDVVSGHTVETCSRYPLMCHDDIIKRRPVKLETVSFFGLTAEFGRIFLFFLFFCQIFILFSQTPIFSDIIFNVFIGR